MTLAQLYWYTNDGAEAENKGPECWEWAAKFEAAARNRKRRRRGNLETR